MDKTAKATASEPQSQVESKSANGTAANKEKGQTLLGKGVDSLYLYLATGLNFGRLEQIAQSMRFGETISICQMDFERSKAYSKAFPVSMQHNVFLFYLNSAGMYIKVAALAFELYGFTETINKLCHILDKLTNSVTPWQDLLRVSRIDVFCDFEYNDDFDQERFKTKLRRRAVFISGKNADGKTYYFGDRSRFCIRLYVKSREIEYSGKTYLKPIWQERGLQPNEDQQNRVWRLEFEYRRKKLEKLHNDLSLANIGGHSQELWAYGIEKLSYMQDRASHNNLCRKQLHPIWQQLKDSLLNEYNVLPEEVKAADVEYRRKRAVTWLCSHSVARGERFTSLSEEIKNRYLITKADYERAQHNYRIHWLEAEQ